MASYLDLDSWPRRAHFDFFRGFELPYFNLCAPVDVTRLHSLSRSAGSPSFSVLVFYLSLRAVNEIEPFRYRLRGDRVLIHEVIHGGATTLRDDESFGFSYFDYYADFPRFAPPAAQALEQARLGRQLEARDEDDALIHYSVLPWVSFTSFAHARRVGREDSVPKIVFGKYYQARGRWLMPTSVEVHHALMDGLHVGRFFERFEALLAEPPLG